MAILALAFWPIRAHAQDLVRDFATQPILVLDTGGHHAAVRRLIFSGDESRLLSAGDDKVVHVWNVAADPPALDRTIRPPIWRGRAGAIYDMALSPPDPQNRQILAIGGLGVVRGEIGLFHYPGAADLPQGDRRGTLDAGGIGADGRESVGHVSTVKCLAFDPSGDFLASGSIDTTVRLWDARRKTHLAVLNAPGQGQINTLAFTPDGRRLVTGGSDGTTRIWRVDARPPQLLASVPPIVLRQNDPAGLAINVLAVSPDGRWLVIGREDGALYRYSLNAANPAANPVKLPTHPLQGAVEGLAFSPDGRLATSIIHRGLAAWGDRPTVDCDIELRRMPDGAVTEQVATSNNLVYALAFSPRGRYLAFAGGDRQGIVLKDLRAPSRPAIEVAGQGASLWDVGFADDAAGLAVAFSYAHPGAEPPATYWGFSLRDRAPTSFARNQVERALAAYDGWTVRPVSPLQLDVVRAGRVAFRVELTDLDRRWWSFSFVPPGPKHDRPVLAVACDRGVAIYRLDDGVLTRFLDGHTGAVYCVAPSRDGKWLATGSSDQTILLWSTAGCDTIAPLGAEFERRGQTLAIKSVTPRGHAEISGLQAGDVIESIYVRARKQEAEAFLKSVAAIAPNTGIEFEVSRPPAAERLRFGTTKRDRPVLSLFVGRDREWVLWMPRGYYDTSVAGDSTLLGWQINRTTPERPLPTDFFPIRTHERALRQPRSAPGNLIDRLLDTGDEAVVLGEQPRDQAPEIVKDRPPPQLTAQVGAGGAAIREADGPAIDVGGPLPERIAMAPGRVVVDWKIVPGPAQAAGQIELRVDGQTIRPSERLAIDAAAGVATVSQPLDLDPGTYRLTALARDETGIERAHHLTAEVVGPSRPKPERLKVLAIAPTFSGPLPQIPFAQKDAEDLAPFFARHLVASSGGPFGAVDFRVKDLLGREATSERSMAGIDAIAGGSVERGDMAVVLIESHVLRFDGKTQIAVADSQGVPPAPALSAETVAQKLGSIVRSGCKVVVVLDGVHEGPVGRAWDPDVVEWIRTLRNEHDVITIVASTRRPSRDYRPANHRVLAQAVFESTRAARPRSSDGLRVLTLADFRKAVLDGVVRLTQGRGEAACYIPEGITAGLPFLDAAPRVARRPGD